MFCKQRWSEELRMGLFRLLARVTIGLLFVGHGTQKLFGWFGGGGIEGTSQAFESLGLRPGRRSAVAAGAAEAGGGLLFALGFATPAAAAALCSVMITAIKTVHWEKGIWTSAGGYEYNLVLLVTVFGLTENGPGPWSVDGALGKPRWGTAWALAALTAGAAGSTAALAASKAEPGEPATETREPVATGA
jgi:putative oxidoreductase